jgi:hypothetical protein
MTRHPDVGPTDTGTGVAGRAQTVDTHVDDARTGVHTWGVVGGPGSRPGPPRSLWTDGSDGTGAQHPEHEEGHSRWPTPRSIW